MGRTRWTLTLGENADGRRAGDMRTSQLSVSAPTQSEVCCLAWPNFADWIEDALHERYARAQAPPRPNSLTARLDMLEGAPGYVWRGLRDALEEGQSWVVITLVGMFTVSTPDGVSVGFV